MTTHAAPGVKVRTVFDLDGLVERGDAIREGLEPPEAHAERRQQRRIVDVLHGTQLRQRFFTLVRGGQILGVCDAQLRVVRLGLHGRAVGRHGFVLLAERFERECAIDEQLG